MQRHAIQVAAASGVAEVAGKEQADLTTPLGGGAVNRSATATAAATAAQKQMQHQQDLKREQTKSKKQALHDSKQRVAKGEQSSAPGGKSEQTKRKNSRIQQLAKGLRSIQTSVPFYEREHISLIKYALSCYHRLKLVAIIPKK